MTIINSLNRRLDQALLQTIDQLDPERGPYLIILDRGYESYWLIHELNERGFEFIIRGRDIGSNGISRNLPPRPTAEFDVVYSITLTRRKTKETLYHPGTCKILSPSQWKKFGADFKAVIPFSVRIVRKKIPGTNTYEVILTNLPKDAFPAEELIDLYGDRWGIEEQFRKLKYDCGLSFLHGYKRTSVLQETEVKILLLNLSQAIWNEAEAEHQRKKGRERKTPSHVQYSTVTKILKKF